MARDSIRVRIRYVVALAVILGGTLTSAAIEPLWLTVVVSAMLVAVTVVGLETGAGLAGIVGLLAGALLVAISRSLGTWDLTAYVPLGILTIALVMAGLAGGALGRSTRRLGRLASTHAAYAPANGSLGLLDRSIAEPRLEEEIERAAYSGSDLSVVWLRTTLRDDATPQPDRGRILRVASRTVESVLGVVHLPFAYSDADLVALLAETDSAAAEELVARIRRSTGGATLLVGAARDRREFSDLATMEIGVASYPSDGQTAAELIEAARARIGPAEPITERRADAQASHADPGRALLRS